MKTATLFCLISLVALPAWAAAPINFKNIASTNVVKTNDLLLIDSDLGGANYATRTIPLKLALDKGIWDNTSGVIAPNGGQTTNVLRFTSGLAGNDTNIASMIDTASAWVTDTGQPTGPLSLALRNNGTNKIVFQANGAILVGSQWSNFWGAPVDSGSIAAYNDTRFGDDDTIFLSAQSQTSSTNYAYGEYIGSSSQVADQIFVWTGAFDNWSVQSVVNQTSLGFRGGHTFSVPAPTFQYLWNFNPTLTALGEPTTQAYIFDTPQTISADTNLVVISNNTTNKFTVAYDGSITTGGNTNRWILGGVTNGAPDVNVDGAHYPLAVTSSPALTGTPTINGQSIETQMTNKVDKTLTTLQSMSGPLAVPSLLIGSMSIGTRSVLTEVGGNIVCDLSLTNRYWSCSPTGNVQVLITNASAGNWGNLLLRWPATNCMFTHGSLPAGSITNWISGAPSTNAVAGTIGFLGIYPIDSTTNSTICGYSATQ